HGGQIWPFHYLVRLDQPTVAGLTRHGARTQLYTSRGTGFWGPPLRIFAPSEITLLTLVSPQRPGGLSTPLRSGSPPRYQCHGDTSRVQDRPCSCGNTPLAR